MSNQKPNRFACIARCSVLSGQYQCHDSRHEVKLYGDAKSCRAAAKALNAPVLTWKPIESAPTGVGDRYLFRAKDGRARVDWFRSDRPRMGLRWKEYPKDRYVEWMEVPK